MVSINSEGSHNHPARDARTLASGRLFCSWRWKLRPLGGRPQIETELRALIRRISVENPIWGGPRIHGELIKLGFEVTQPSVAKYMVKRRGRLSQGSLTFLPNHAPDIAAMDLFVDLGSGLIDQSQKITLAAMQMADMKVWAHRS